MADQREEPSGLEQFGPALVSAMVHVADAVVILDSGGLVEYMNPCGIETFGYAHVDDVIGMSLIDIVHPEDLDRVIVAMARMMDVDNEVPGRPAQVRVRGADGTYVRVEANGALGAPDGESAGRVVVTARPTTDADLHEHLMNVLTTGAPSEKAFELVPEFGLWRQPTLLHGVFALDDDATPIAFGHPSLLALGLLDDPESPWTAVARSGEELFVAADELDSPARERARQRGITHLRARPVIDALHRTNAVVVMARDDTSPLPAERSTLEFSWFAIDKMASVLAMALAWRGQAVELRRAAATDPLTGLANRAGFWSGYRRVPTEVASKSVTVLCLDLDHFKPVNDTHGHAVGDSLLIDVADRLRHAVSAGDLVARLGGDEFTVVVHDLDDAKVAEVADRIVTAMSEPFTIQGHQIEIGASLGIATAPVDGFDADHLLDAADKALYEAKNTGRNQWIRSRSPTFTA